MYVITGIGKHGKKVKVYRKTLAEAKKHAAAARTFGGRNIKIRKT